MSLLISGLTVSRIARSGGDYRGVANKRAPASAHFRGNSPKLPAHPVSSGWARIESCLEALSIEQPSLPARMGCHWRRSIFSTEREETRLSANGGGAIILSLFNARFTCWNRFRGLRWPADTFRPTLAFASAPFAIPSSVGVTLSLPSDLSNSRRCATSRCRCRPEMVHDAGVLNPAHFDITEAIRLQRRREPKRLIHAVEVDVIWAAIG